MGNRREVISHLGVRCGRLDCTYGGGAALRRDARDGWSGNDDVAMC